MKENPDTDKIIDAYLTDLREALSGVPASRRNQIVTEIAEHIDEGRQMLDVESDLTVRAMLDRIGDPAEIAMEAGSVPGRSLRRRSDPWVPWLLLFGGFVGLVFPLLAVAWLVGVALLWISPTWNIGQKLLGTFVLPGGLLPLMIMLIQPVAVTSCSSYEAPGRPAVEHCSSSGHTLPPLIGIPVFVVALVAPILTALYLGSVERRVRAAMGVLVD
jgi:hypothetical protein